MKILLITIIIIALGVVSDFYICRTVMKNRLLKRLFLIKSILMQIMMITAVLSFATGSDFLPFALLQWLFVIYFLFYIPQSVFLVFSLMDYFVKWKIKTFRFFTLIGFVVSSVFMFFILYGMTYGRCVPRVERIEVKSERLPESFENYKIVQLSDIHLGNFFSNTNIVERVVNKVNELNPDLILITGDLVNLRADEIEPFKDILSQLKAKDAVFSVFGNHDYGSYAKLDSNGLRKNVEDLKRFQADMGWETLNNDNSFIYKGSDSIAVIGVENWGLPPFYGNGDLRASYPSLKDDVFKILMSHNPTHWEKEVIPYSNVDLTVSGHTHAMQMKLNLGRKSYSPASLMYVYWSGLYKKDNQYLYVNDGIGYVGVPLRIGTRPEITEIILRNSL